MLQNKGYFDPMAGTLSYRTRKMLFWLHDINVPLRHTENAISATWQENVLRVTRKISF